MINTLLRLRMCLPRVFVFPKQWKENKRNNRLENKILAFAQTAQASMLLRNCHRNCELTKEITFSLGTLGYSERELKSDVGEMNVVAFLTTGLKGKRPGALIRDTMN